MVATTTYDFDTIINRRGVQSVKHDVFPDGVIPMWVADMDFRSPPEVIEAIKARADHGVFGYSMPPKRLTDLLVERLGRLYNWQIQPDNIVFMPGVISTFNVAIRAYGQPGANVLMPTPIYPPMLAAPPNNGQTVNGVPMTASHDGSRLRYEIDFDAFEAAINENTKTLLFCSPHNPVGRVWTRDELIRVAEICEKHDIIIISDEIHCDLLYSGQQHIPIASLSPEIAARTITTYAPSKTYNIPSLGFSFAVITNPDLHKRFAEAQAGLVPHVSVFGYTAGLAAYEHGDDWLRELMVYLEGNRDLITEFVASQMPGISVTEPEGTYLAWLDTSAVIEDQAPTNEFAKWIDGYFLENAKVALNRGGNFGEPGEGFVRLNYAMPRSKLTEGLTRMSDALKAAPSNA